MSRLFLPGQSRGDGARGAGGEGASGRRAPDTGIPFYPGGGGQLPYRGVLHWRNGETSIAGFSQEGDGLWVCAR